MDLHGLPTELEQFVKQEIAEGRFASVEEVVSAALRLFQEREAKGKNGQPVSNGSSTRTSDDYLGAISQALENDDPVSARRLALEGTQRYPEQTELKKYADVLAPPSGQVTPSSPQSRAAVKADHAWVKAHGEEYRGHWIALQSGHLLSSSPSFDEVMAEVGDVRGRNIYITKIN